jgi:hypothetical protein
MKNIKIIIALILLLANAWGCEKLSYTLPADFRLDMSISNKQAMGSTLTVDLIQIRLNSIDIQGYRETGSNVFLSRSFGKGKTFTIKADTDNETISFDIPQGVYNPLSFSMIFQHDDDEDDLIEDIEEWYEDVLEGDDDPEELQEELGSIIEDYLDDISPAVLVKGSYRSQTVSARLILLVNDPMTFRILLKNRNGGEEVILEKDRKNAGELILDPSYWFSVITPEMMNAAFRGKEDGVTYIFLSKYVNSHIYNAVFNRMEESTSIIVN